MFQSEWTAADDVAAPVLVRLATEDQSLDRPWVERQAGQTTVMVPRRTTLRKTQKAFREALKLAAGLSPAHIGLDIRELEPASRRSALWGAGQGVYRFRLTDQKVTGPKVSVLDYPGVDLDLAILQGQSRVRDWINLPSNVKPPEHLAELMQADSSANIQWTAYHQDGLRDMGAGGILGVGQGSHRPPVLLVGRYEGKPGSPWIALVGKGITFDSGGISLKHGDGMGRMKGDMGGAAAVAAAFRTAAEIGLLVNVMAVLPLAENLPGGGAFRPGDVLTMMDGTLVEVISTDAEGRLVLGDGVTWAIRHGASAVVDMATLTGANVVALGGIRSALIANHDGLAGLVRDAAERAAEPTWEMPHDEDYADLNKTSAADIKNSGGRPAGTVTAGLFIGHFAKDVAWAHLDIAGLSFESDGSGVGAGATGYGAATLVEVLKSFGERPPL